LLAGTRAAKGVGFTIPNLFLHECAAFIIDPNGENARITAAARTRLGPVAVLDPFEISQRSRLSRPLMIVRPTEHAIDILDEAEA
jgi:type IV secretion system protein VirD4